MASNSNLEVVNLDFDTIKNNLKKYLSNQPQFSDYDFEGSNINVLLDVLAYNTYMNSFYLNMVASEMFLDSAQLRDSVISHAKELNYLPQSFRSSRASVNITIRPASNVESVTILKGTSCTSRVGSNTYSFVVDENIVLTSTNNVFTAANVSIYEGDLVSETFVYDSANTTSQMVISNPTVDTRSINVYVYEDNGENVLTYTRGTSFLGLNANSQVFFIQPARNDSYEVVFGNGVQGRKPKDGSTVVVGYRACNGELPNGAAVFSIDGPIDGHSNVTVTTVSSASGGAVHESLQSIKKNAPRYFQTQERAVTASDYKTLLQTQFPEISSINVYGGEDADPPQYGRVFISVDLTTSDGTPAYKKQIYKDYLKTITPLSIDSVFIDPEFMYLAVTTNVNYNLNTIQVTENSLISLVNTKIRVFNEQNLDDFNVTFRYSKLISDIDSADTSVISNDTDVQIYKEITPVVNTNNNYVINFDNKLDNPYTEAAPNTRRSADYSAVFSTPFTIDSQTCRIEDNNAGRLDIVTIVGEDHVYFRTIGSVDYNTGKVTIENFNPSNYTNGAIRINVIPLIKDVSALRNNIIKIKPTDIVVTATGIRA